jgi:CRISPR/Cas system Type II protein with McrA/HNH and RuvC-like nuclease domain
MQRPKISQKIKDKIRLLADNRCGYCLCRQEYVWDILEIDHIIPIAKSGTNDEENLWLVCETCNRAKSDKVEGFDSVTNSNSLLFNPRTQIWHEHFDRVDNYTQISGKTKVGRVTVKELNLNKERLIKVRENWVTVGWHPPKD